MTTKAPLIIALAGVLALGIVGFGILRTNGYVITREGVFKGATLVIENARPGAVVFIDNIERAVVPQDATSVTVSGIAPQESDVIIALNDAWPWIDRIVFETNTSYTRTPLLLAREPDALPITQNMPGHEAASAAFARTTLPTAVAPLFSTDQRAFVWADNATVYARINGEAITTFTGKEPIRALAWFPNRFDTLIVAAGSQIFVVDIDPKNPQNFFPIYSGLAPTFGLDGTGDLRIYVRDGATLLLMGLGA